MTRHGRISIESFALGPWQTNCYVVRGENGGGFVVDCGMAPGPLLDAADGVTAIVLTHAHVDHIAGLLEARRRMPGVPIWNHEAEAAWLLDAELNLSAFGGMPVTAPPADRSLTDGETVSLAGESWRVLHTPGHSPGSISLWCEAAGVVLSGDALFAGSIGRTDFPGCSFEALERSIRERLYTLPAETVVYPGHGPSTTIAKERATNPFVRG